MVERRSVAGAKGLVAEASRKSTRRKSHPLIVNEKTEKARVDAGRQKATGAEFLIAKAARLSARLNTKPLTDEQKAKNVADAVRYQQSRLTIEQKAEKVRIETERRNAKSSQAAAVRLLNKRHCYATRSATVTDSVVANASDSNKVLNVQP